MQTVIYSDVNGYGTVHAHSIAIYVYSPEYGGPINPIALLSPFRTYHFGTNRVLFQID
ncbi:hypothetical protein LCGC14_2239480 [marine sediment metagenome]|uniref:Uncharacterized protein n=1 Tax=marine sediment metagenome TaxID=412755 RepID=A0A0F9FIF1_9ZZZZ